MTPARIATVQENDTINCGGWSLLQRQKAFKNKGQIPFGGSFFSSTPYECKADQIVYDRQDTLADWRAGVIPHALDILRTVHEKFNAGPPSDAEVVPLMQKLLNRQM